MVSLKHKFHSSKGDGTDSTLLRPSNWNDQHDLTLSTPSVLGAAVAGPATERPITVAAGGTDPIEFYTKAAVDAAIAAALNLLDVTVTGDLRASLNAGKPHWLLCNGQTIGQPGATANFANALAQPLYNFLWAFNSATWPVLGPGGVPSRGVSAAADWAASKVIAVPDARGCTFGMPDLGAGVAPEILKLGLVYGVHKVSLADGNIPAHTHTLPDPVKFLIRNDIGGTGSGHQIWYDEDLDPVLKTGRWGGDPAADLGDDPTAVVPVSLVQPTMGVNVFIKL